MRIILNNAGSTKTLNDLPAGSKVSDALAAVGWELGNLSLRIAGVTNPGLDTVLTDGQIILLLAPVKGN